MRETRPSGFSCARVHACLMMGWTTKAKASEWRPSISAVTASAALLILSLVGGATGAASPVGKAPPPLNKGTREMYCRNFTQGNERENEFYR